MATTTEAVRAFSAFDQADRLRRALRVSGVSVQEMADYLEVSRNTVGSWINGRNKPAPPALRAWALRTGAPYSWLKNGETPDAGGDGGLEMVRPEGFEPPTFWLGVSPVLTCTDAWELAA